jgi:16S rRNA (cytidine1402-2'-O)-methyltransferase
MLYIISTPIGNLKDITLRAIETLKSVDLIAAEDTRHTKTLCAHFDIKTPLTSYFEHNQFKKSKEIVEMLKAGRNVALVSDAGTPGINDPGYRLIELAIKEDLDITVVPGPTACIAALSVSGLPTDRFVFEGFLPVKSGARKKKLERVKEFEGTVIFYESPHRVLAALEDIKEVLGDMPVVCVREITKKFEEIKRGSAQDLIAHFSAHSPKGEFVILLHN